MPQKKESCIFEYKHREGKCELPSYDDKGLCYFHTKDITKKDLSGKDMTRCPFLQEAYLVDANLNWADFSESNLDYADLRGASLWRTKLDGTQLAHADFRGADLYNTVLQNSLYLKSADIDYIEVNEQNGDYKRRHLAKDYIGCADSYGRAQAVHRDLKRYFSSVGLHDRSGEHYVRERSLEGRRLWIAPKITSKKHFRWHFPEYGFCTSFLWRALLFLKTRTRWLLNRFLYYTSRYGESPSRVLACYVLIAVLCSLVYWAGDGIARNTVVPGSSSEPVSYLECLYFSIVTFTTLGFGDFAPKGAEFQLLAATEAFTGASLLAYFVVVVSRKIMR